MFVYNFAPVPFASMGTSSTSLILQVPRLNNLITYTVKQYTSYNMQTHAFFWFSKDMVNSETEFKEIISSENARQALLSYGRC